MLEDLTRFSNNVTFGMEKFDLVGLAETKLSTTAEARVIKNTIGIPNVPKLKLRSADYFHMLYIIPFILRRRETKSISIQNYIG